MYVDANLYSTCLVAKGRQRTETAGNRGLARSNINGVCYIAYYIVWQLGYFYNGAFLFCVIYAILGNQTQRNQKTYLRRICFLTIIRAANVICYIAYTYILLYGQPLLLRSYLGVLYCYGDNSLWAYCQVYYIAIGYDSLRYLADVSELRKGFTVIFNFRSVWLHYPELK